MDITLTELLYARNLKRNSRVKLVRHQDKRFDVTTLYRQGYLEIYQSYQSKDVFNCDYIVSFIGFEGSGNLAMFTGVYKVLGKTNEVDIKSQNEFPYKEIIKSSKIYYHLEKEPGFEDLIGRVIIDWGKGALAWHQWIKSDKHVVEILPKGFISYCPDYLDICITYSELKEIINNPSASRDWHRLLSSVAGIYLILDTKSGQQYVGSAYGDGGILERWSHYAKSKHGGNKKLIKIIENNPSAANNFIFSILQTLPKTMTPTEVIRKEKLYKEKLGSRAFGLNDN